MLPFEVKPLEQIVSITYNRSKGTGGEGPADSRHRLNHARLAFRCDLHPSYLKSVKRLTAAGTMNPKPPNANEQLFVAPLKTLNFIHEWKLVQLRAPPAAQEG